MMEDKLIPARDVCMHYRVDLKFIDDLQEYELISFEVIEEQPFIQSEQLSELEKLIRFHQELSLNIEGIDAVYRLSKKLEAAQEEIQSLRNRVSFYERGFR
jgi:chaperone modulatory protein CbpM